MPIKCDVNIPFQFLRRGYSLRNIRSWYHIERWQVHNAGESRSWPCRSSPQPRNLSCRCYSCIEVRSRLGTRGRVQKDGKEMPASCTSYEELPIWSCKMRDREFPCYSMFTRKDWTSCVIFREMGRQNHLFVLPVSEGLTLILMSTSKRTTSSQLLVHCSQVSHALLSSRLLILSAFFQLVQTRYVLNA